ncbi:putative transmembrane protein [Senna tora]|uniref:Putative transmembrane protein n=1 Tax=Senna tora TaxID=362788 RepID=A0A834WS26_9FABA|nr:putative transmembrane protein [Senna tora]
MALKIKTFLVVLLLVFMPLTSSGLVEGFRENMHATTHHLVFKHGKKMSSRKLFNHEYMLDYDEGGASTKHKKPGKGP